MNSGIFNYNKFNEGNIIISKKKNNNNNNNNKILGIVNKNSNKINSKVVVRVKNPYSSYLPNQKKTYNKKQIEKKITFEIYNVGNVVLKKKNGRILGVVNKKSNEKNSKVNVKLEKKSFFSKEPNIKTYNKIYVEKKKKYEPYKEKELVYNKNGKYIGIVKKESTNKENIVFIEINDERVKNGKRTIIKTKNTISKKPALPPPIKNNNL